jgi:AraC-like DNA-binding protein
MEIIGLLNTLIEKNSIKNINEDLLAIPNNDHLRVLKIEKYLCENLENKFEGIDALASKFNISSTKLKPIVNKFIVNPFFSIFKKNKCF